MHSVCDISRQRFTSSILSRGGGLVNSAEAVYLEGSQRISAGHGANQRTCERRQSKYIADRKVASSGRPRTPLLDALTSGRSQHSLGAWDDLPEVRLYPLEVASRCLRQSALQTQQLVEDGEDLLLLYTAEPYGGLDAVNQIDEGP